MYKNKTIKIVQDDCCGCGTCYSICPKNAISISVNTKGIYPKIDDNLCINCGKCLNYCSVDKQQTISVNEKSMNVYAVINKDKKTLNTSSSGGVFYNLAKHIINQNGVVYGVEFDSNFVAKTCRTDNLDALKKMMGSKYVQAILGDCFLQVKNDLLNERIVLFSGVPCQVHSLLHYLKIEKVNTNNLFTIDLICHGVPSPSIFEQYIGRLQKKYKSELIDYSFRNKKNGEVQGIRATFKNHLVYEKSTTTDEYYKLFSYDLILRESCYKCKFTSKTRVGDITLGDYWGYKGLLQANDGISLVLCNTNKGKNIFDKISHDFIVEQTSFEKCIQQPLVSATKKPLFRNIVIECLKFNNWSVPNFITSIIRVKNHFRR